MGITHEALDETLDDTVLHYMGEKASATTFCLVLPSVSSSFFASVCVSKIALQKVRML